MHRCYFGLLALIASMAGDANVLAQPSELDELDPGTGVEMWVGLRYQTGETNEDDELTVPADALLALELFAHHEGRWADRLWRAELVLATDTYASERSEDYDTLSLRLGQVSESIRSWRVYTALAGDYAVVGYDPFYGGAALWLAAEPTIARSIRWIHARFGREEFASSYPGSDAWVTDFELGFGFDGLFADDASAWIGPALRYNHAESRQLRYGQFELYGEYSIPLRDGWSLAIDALAWRRLYAGHEEASRDDRRDWYLVTGSSLWVDGFASERLSLELRYEYERNWSDDRSAEYESHNPGIYLHWAY